MENIFEKSMVIYPEKMRYETEENKKAGYAEIVQNLEELLIRINQDYNLHDAVCLTQTLTDTLMVMSPEIYEHFRKLEDMLRSLVRTILQKEGLTTNHFGPIKLPVENENANKEDYSMLGRVLMNATNRNYLLAEKYEALGKALEMRL